MPCELLKLIIERESVNVRHVSKSVPKNPSNIEKHGQRVADTQDFSTPVHTLDSKSVNHLGVGAEAIVFQNKNKPQQSGVVTKWIRNQPAPYKENPVILYLMYGNATSNPLIPVVYEIKSVSNPNNTYDFYIKMEKLHATLYDMKGKMEQAQVDALFRQVIDNYDDTHPLSLNQLLGIIKHGVTNTEVTLNGIEYTYTEQMIKWCDIMNHALLKGSGKIDIHGNNAMVRITSVGMQLVMNDPIYSQG